MKKVVKDKEKQRKADLKTIKKPPSKTRSGKNPPSKKPPSKNPFRTEEEKKTLELVNQLNRKDPLCQLPEQPYQRPKTKEEIEALLLAEQLNYKDPLCQLPEQPYPRPKIKEEKEEELMAQVNDSINQSKQFLRSLRDQM